jgi:hypothetical protein
MSQTGAILDTAGIAVCTTAGDQVTPAVAFNGTDYLVLWQHQTPGSRDLYGARISPQGVVLDSGGFAISAAPGIQQQPAIASDGANFLVVWSGERDVDIYAVRVTGTGTVLDTAGIHIPSAAGSQTCPAVEYDGASFVVVWQDQRGDGQDIYGARVTPQGSILDTFVVTTRHGNQLEPALARGSGNGMLTVYSGWVDVREGMPYNSLRIWGMLSPGTGIGDGPVETACAERRTATVVRGVLLLPQTATPGPQAASSLLDISGRKVADLHAGPNDLGRLSPGIYFMREASGGPGSKPRTARKLVLTR